MKGIEIPNMLSVNGHKSIIECVLTKDLLFVNKVYLQFHTSII